jgi:hypothetical protein
MSYLHPNSSENLATRITNKGRKRIAEGNFKISYFQIGDSEFNYNLDLSLYSGSTVLMPFDYDTQIKYPYLSSDSSYTGTTTGATFGSVINLPITTSVFNYTGGTQTWNYVKITSGTTTNPYLGSKQYFGYGDSGYTSDDIVILHYSQMGTTGNTFLYEDYISHDSDDVNTWFTVFGSTNNYNMGTGVTYVYDSGITDTYPNHMAYVDLLSGTTIIGKIFINSKIITIHDQSIVSVMGNSGTTDVALRSLIDLEVMNMYVNLPGTYYTKTQNPTWSTGKPLMITEIGFFNENRELLVITKCDRPIQRLGTQVINVTLDI